MTTLRLAVLALLAAMPAPAVGQAEWVAAGVRDGVTLAYREDARLEAREVRAVAELPFAADRIRGLVCDFTRPLDPDVREARVISGRLDDRYEVYLRYAPRYAVVAARDVVIEVRPQPVGCTWSEVAGRLEPQAGIVRMPLLRGSWLIEAIDASHSRVTYQITVRPGGRIPGWMVRRGAVSAMPDVIARVKKLLQSAR